MNVKTNEVWKIVRNVPGKYTVQWSTRFHIISNYNGFAAVKFPSIFVNVVLLC